MNEYDEERQIVIREFLLQEHIKRNPIDYVVPQERPDRPKDEKRSS